MKRFKHKIGTALAATTILFAGSACAHPHTTPTPQERVAVSAADLELGPALWKVADEDTTIYLFGTVHFLPEGADWYQGQIRRAAESSDTLVTEIDTRRALESGQAMAQAGRLPPAVTLRSMMSKQDKNALEKALKSLDFKNDTVDNYKPWLAAISLSTSALRLNGYMADNGSESVLEQLASTDKKFDHLESIQFQIDIWDKMPKEQQWVYLRQTISELPKTSETIEAIVGEWLEGDVDGLARIIDPPNKNETLHKRFFTDRNANWAGWIDERMDTPGTVFVAVGAGHLAGKDSVQDYLAARGIAVTRLQ